MRIHLITVANRVPSWVEAGFQEYARRLPACPIQLIEIRPKGRSSSAAPMQLREAEGERIRAAIPKGAWVVALDEQGPQWSSIELSRHLAKWMQAGRDLALLIGGADGLDPRCIAEADQIWSLSSLTLPHTLTRVVVAEQIYRAWSMLSHHPYHRP